MTRINPNAIRETGVGQPPAPGADPSTAAREKALDLISNLKNVQLITYPARGFPRARLMGYYNVGWEIEFLTRAGNLKTREIAADQRCTFLWCVSHLETEPMRVMIQLDGHARPLENEEKHAMIERRISKSGPRMREVIERVGYERQATFRVTPVRLRIQGILGGEEHFLYRTF